MADTALRADFEYYVEHQAALARRYQGRYIVVRGGVVLGDYETASEAVRETVRRYKPGTFLVQLCDADPDSIKQTFHSRVRLCLASFRLPRSRSVRNA